MHKPHGSLIACSLMLVVVGCGSAAVSGSPGPSTSPSGQSTGSPRPSLTSQPTDMPIGRIEHSTGLTDVLLRFDSSPDYGICELCGGWGPFTPGPEFTLYGDGTVISRNDRAEQPPAEGPIIRATAFKVAHLDENRIQSLLRFALGEGGL